MESKLFLTIAEAADRLGIGRSHFYQLLARGDIASVRLGRSRRVPVRALEDFADSKIAEAKADQ